MTEAELRAEMDTVKTLRGARKTEAAAALAARGDDLLPGLGAVVADANAATRKLAWQLLAGLHPGTEAGRAALGAVLVRMLGSGPSVRQEALDRLTALGRHVSGVTDAVAHQLTSGADAPAVLQALGILSGLGLDDPELVAAVEPAFDHWDPEVRAAAVALVGSRGGTPRPSVWEGAPVSSAMLRQIQKLGGTCGRPFDPSEPRPIPDSWAVCGQRTSWTNEDPRGECTEVPPTIGFFDRNVRWSRGTTFGFRKWGEERTLEFSGASENFDVAVDGVRRLLLVQAYDSSAQFYYCFDLFDRTDDPAVYSIDHDGTGPSLASPTFSEFARNLWVS